MRTRKTSRLYRRSRKLRKKNWRSHRGGSFFSAITKWFQKMINAFKRFFGIPVPEDIIQSNKRHVKKK